MLREELRELLREELRCLLGCLSRVRLRRCGYSMRDVGGDFAASCRSIGIVAGPLGGGYGGIAGGICGGCDAMDAAVYCCTSECTVP